MLTPRSPSPGLTSPDTSTNGFRRRSQGIRKRAPPIRGRVTCGKCAGASRGAVGENFYGPRDLQPSLRKMACDYVMPDFMRIGGVTGWLRAAAIAGAVAQGQLHIPDEPGVGLAWDEDSVARHEVPL